MGRTLTSLNLYFDDFELGDRFTTASRTIVQEDIDVYSKLSGDNHPMHTDAAVAAREIFGALSAQGCLTLSVATGLEYSLIGPDIRGILAFSGLDRVRFLRPVLLGDTVHLEGEVTALELKGDDRGLVVIHQEIKNQRGETAVILDKRMFHKRRP